MKIELAIAILLLPSLLSAQEQVTVKGRIVNEKGDAVEYVQVGMPEVNIGTIATADGRFEIEVPPGTLEFFHVSYQPAFYRVDGPAKNVVIVMQEQELEPVVVIGGDTKEKFLVRPGARVAGGIGTISLRSEQYPGRELGVVAQTKKPFLVKNIMLSVWENTIPDCVASINIYRIEGRNESFVNVLHKPIYFNVAVSDKPQEFDIKVEETLLLEPGKYFISFQIVGCDENALRAFLAKPVEEQNYNEFTLSAKLYLKSSYLREAALGQMQPCSFNLGISVKGLEYQ